MTTLIAPLTPEQSVRSPYDYIADSFFHGSEAVSTSGRAAQERRRLRPDRTSTSQQAYRYWQAIHLVFDEVDDSLLDTLRFRPQIGDDVLSMAFFLDRFFPISATLAIRASDDETSLARQWLVIVRTSMPPEQAFERLNRFDDFWEARPFGQKADSVVATVELT